MVSTRPAVGGTGASLLSIWSVLQSLDSLEKESGEGGILRRWRELRWVEVVFAGGPGTHCYPRWQLLASFSPGSQWVTMNQHPLEFKLGKDSSQSVQVFLEHRSRSFKKEMSL